MNLKLKLIKKIVSLILAVLLFINPLVVPVVYAEETAPPQEIVSPEPTPTDPAPTQTESLSVENGDPSPTPAPESTITTGDAEASSQTDTTANDNEDTVEVPLDDSVGIGNSNQADVSNDLDSSANTGMNQESGSAGDASIDTGDATASGQMTSDINSNTVVATASPTLTLTPTPAETSETSSESSDGGSGSEGSETPTAEVKDLTVTNENDSKVTDEADVLANTGNNVASENLGDVDLKTGDALAWLNLLNFLNTNIVGSNFELLVLDVNENSGEIDLNELWKQLQEQSSSDSVFLVGDESSSNLRLVVSNKNTADLENNVNVCVTTGDNQANQNNSAEVDTGDATALANIINMVNANILGSKFFFGIINITGQFTGNLILPRPERFLGTGDSTVGGEGTVFENQNTASLSDILASWANSGGNTENNNGGDNTIDTGSATAVSTDLSLVNLNLYQNDWFYLLMNILGSWNGKTSGWSNPEATDETTGQNQAYEVGSQSSLPEGSSTDIGSTPPIDFQNQNTANVRNNINVSASTGGNQANGNINGASIKTGNAKAVLNMLNLINLNILASRWFMGLVNVLGSWSGNTIFAYPDLTVSLSGSPEEVSPGDSFEYVLDFANQGYDDAEDVSVKMDFPRGLLYEGDDSGVPANCSSQNCSWGVGNLKRAQGGSFRIKVRLDPNFLSISQTSFLEKLIPQVYAAEGSSSFVVKASVATIIPESDNNNNVSERMTGVKEPAESAGGVDFGSGSNQESGVDQRLPVLEVTAKNNVNDFVYPKDIVTFEITVKNTGEVRSEKTYLTHALYNGVPEDLGIARINIGTIEPGRTAKITFGITLADGEEFHAGSYHSITKAIGYAPNGSEVSSNGARTDFKIRLKEIASLFEARAIGKEEDQVLGTATNCPVPQEKILPYVLLFILSAFWIVDRSRRLSERYLINEKLKKN